MQIKIEDGMFLVVDDELIKRMVLEKVGLKQKEEKLTWADKQNCDKKWTERIRQIKGFKNKYTCDIRKILTEQYPDDLNTIYSLGISGYLVKKPISGIYIHHIVRKIK